MTTQKIQIQDETHWHELRSLNIGASEIATLFGHGMSLFTLWHYKAGNIENPIDDGERMFWGRQNEGSIAEGFAILNRWNIEKNQHYYYQPLVSSAATGKTYGIGATPDYIRDDGVLIEIKNVDRGVFYESWYNPLTQENEPPVHILLQVQQQLMLTGEERAIVAALVGGNDGHVFEIRASQKIHAAIRNRAISFWASVYGGAEPDPMKPEDLKTVKQLSRSDIKEGVIDLTYSGRFEALCQAYLEAKAQATESVKAKDLAEAQIIQMLAGYSIADVNGFFVTHKPNKRGHRLLRVVARGQEGHQDEYSIAA